MINKYRYALLAAVALTSAALGIYAGMQKSASVTTAVTTTSTQSRNATTDLFTQNWPEASGSDKKISDWQGKTLVVNFWATWCPPCVKEMPELSALQASVDVNRIQIIGIGIDSAENISSFTKKHPVSYPLYIAGNDGIQISRDLGNQAGGLPFTVLVDKNGKIKKTYSGVKIEELKQDLAAL